MAAGPQPKSKMKRGMRFAKRTIASTKLSKRIGWLNNNAGLAQEIRYSEVKDLLSQVGDREAMRLLSTLEERSVRDPTAYLKTSALRLLEEEQSALGGEAKAPEASGGGRRSGNRDKGAGAPPDEDVVMQKIEKRVQWLNTNAGLSQDLLVEDIGPGLVSAGLRQAMQILKSLEERAEEVPDPNAFVLELMERGDGGAPPDEGPDGGAGGGEEAPTGRKRHRRTRGAGGPGRNVIKTGMKEKPDQAFAEQVRRRVQWLNGHANLAQELDYDKVGDLLVRIGDQRAAMKLLKELEDKASEVRDPTAYVSHTARSIIRERQEQQPPPRQEPWERSGRAAAPPPQQPDSKVSRRIGWLNKNAMLSVPLDFERVAPFLTDLDTQEAMEILRRLEQNAAEVRDPSAYVIAAAKRIIDEPGPQAATWVAHAPPPGVQALPMGPAASNIEAKLQKRIAWLNDHADLASPLDYDRVASELLSVDLLTAFEVLNNLEENASTVRDPSAYVAARARRARAGVACDTVGAGPGPPSGEGRGRRTPAPPRDPPPSMGLERRARSGTPALPPPGNEDRLVKRVEWLNRNVCANSPLDLDEVVPVLLDLSFAQAMEVLKRFEDGAHEVRNPNAYVITAARRTVDTRGGGRQAIGMGPPQGGRTPRGSAGGGGASGSRPSSAGSGGRMPIGSSRGGGDRGDRGRPMMALPGAPAMDEKVTYYGGVEEKIRRKIDWMDRNVPMTMPLGAARVIPELLKVKPVQAFEILHKLEENVHEVRDPTGYVISLARRCFVEGGSGSGPGPGPARRRRRGGGGGGGRGGVKEEPEDAGDADDPMG